MLRLTRWRSRVREHSRSQGSSTRGDGTPNARRLRMEPLEDRRMLSLTLFVDADATAGGDGLGWDSAYNDLQAALDDAGGRNADTVGGNDVDQIWIAEGVYRPTAALQPGIPQSASFSLLDGVTLYGGFGGTETALEDRDWSAHVTTLSGDIGTLGDNSDNAYTVVYCGADIEAGVDGVSIVEGMAKGPSSFSRPEARNGGGIYSSGTLTVANSTLFGNSAHYGGGIYNDAGMLTVTDSTLSGNATDGNGYRYGSAGRGGGIYSTGWLTVTNSTLSGNWAIGNTEDTSDYPGGGGIYSSGTLRVTNSTFSGNLSYDGAGIYNSRTLTMTNSTLSGNSAERLGGGVYTTGSSSSATLNNTVVAGNTASSGPDVFHHYDYPATLSGFHNLIGDGTGQSLLVDGAKGNQVGTSDSPIDPLLSDWSELGNGRWGYYLLPGSPALDAGENALAVDWRGQPLGEDISGSPRIQNGTVDIGALEGVAPAGPAQTYVVTSLDRTIAEDGVLTFLEALEAANRNQPVGDAPAGSFTEADAIQFAEGLSGTVPVEDGELVIHGNLNIDGPGAARLAFDAGGANRVFLISPGVSARLSGMTITGGSAGDGGGIYNCYGTLTVANSMLAENSAGAYLGRGGGIFNSGTLTVTGSTLSENSADRHGGGICNSGTLAVTNSTLSRNSALGDYGYGGGISNYSGTLTITNSTLSGNWAERGGGISSYYGSSVTVLNNTIAAGNAASYGPDIYCHLDLGVFSGSHNLIGNGWGQSAFVDGENGNQVGIDPLLSDWTEFADGRGGYYLLPGSPALDAGENALAVDAAGQPLVEDGLGRPRIQNGTVDIGALEGAAPDFPGQVYVVASLDRTVAEDGVLTFLEAFEAANRNQPVGDAPGGSFTEADIIRFADGLSGTIPLEDGELAIIGDLSIEGPGAAHLTFDGQGAGRVFLIEHFVFASLSGMTITGGSADEGGGIYNDHGLLTITNVTLSGNSSGYKGGGGIHSSGILTVTNSTLSGNSSRCCGGGIYSSGTLTVTDSTLSGNSAHTGGGIYSTGALTITDSTLSGNWAEDDNANNSDSGGGICSYRGMLTVTNCTLSQNWAGDYGGGIYSTSSKLTVTNSTLSRNWTHGSGGGIYHSAGMLTVTNSTLSENRADYSGGGICSVGKSSTATLNNTIVAENAASSGPDIYLDRGTLSGSYNLIGNGSGQTSLVDGENGNQVGTPISPIDPLLSDWTELDNGRWGYYLLAGSPALDAGQNNLAVDAAGQPLVEDIYGDLRIQNGTVDIGSIEGATVADPTPVYVVTSLDLTVAEDGVLTFLEALEAANRNKPVGDAPAGSFAEADVIQFAEGLSGTISVEDGELAIQGDLSIEGPGAGILAFDAGGENRVFLIRPGVSASLSGATITGGSGDLGGGIYNDHGTLAVTNSTFSGNSADGSGGGICNDHGTLMVTNSTFSVNTAGAGSGIYSRSGSLTVINSTFSGNSAQYGGAICNQASTLTVTDTTLSGNSAESQGGGIFSYSGKVTVTNSTVSENSAEVHGGGIWSRDGILTVINSTLSGNYGSGIRSEYGTVTVTNSTISENDGNGIWTTESPVTVTNSTIWGNNGRGISSSEHNINRGPLTVTNSTLSGNSGGGIYCYGTLTVTNSTLSGNSAYDYGGGIHFFSRSSTATLNNTIVAGNAAPSEPDIYLASGTLTGSHNLIGDGSGQSSIVHGVDGNLVGTAESPIDPRFLRDPSDGGDGWGDDPDTPDIDESANDNYGDLHLLSDSPAVNAGNIALLPADTFDLDADGNTTEPIPFDLDERPRLMERRVDMGAYEQATGTPGVLFVDGDGPVDGDGLCWETAYADLQLALDSAAARNADTVGENDVDSIWVAEGVYKPSALLESGDARSASFSLVDGVTLYGGFSGTETALEGRDWSARVTTFSGDLGTPDDNSDNAYTVVYCGADIEAGVDGVSIVEGMAKGPSSFSRPEARNGGGIYNSGTLALTNATVSGNSADHGGGIYNSGTLTVTNSMLSGNSAAYNGVGFVHGGGIYNSGTLTVANSILSGNSTIDDYYGGGGGVYNLRGTLTVDNSTLSGNSAGRYGGAIHNHLGTLVVTNSTLSANSADGERGGGGGIYNTSGTVTVTNSTLSENSAGLYGGGIRNSRGTVAVINSTFSGNAATGDSAGGGGIYSEGELTVTDSTFSENSADGARGGGGGIYNASGTVTVTNSTLSGNSAAFWGGGIYNFDTLTVTNSTLSGNSTWRNPASGVVKAGTLPVTDSTLSEKCYPLYGGGIFNSRKLTVINSTLSGNSARYGGGIYSSGTLTVANSTLSGNTAYVYGGGMSLIDNSSAATLNNTIVAGNTASSEPDIYLYSSTLSGSDNLIGDGTGQSALINGQDGNLVGTAENPIDPLFVRAPSDGGDGWGDDPDTPDIDESANDDYGDLRILPDSPAINAGDNVLLPPDACDLDGDGDVTEPIPFDLDGNRRVLGGTVDIGAYEYSPVVELPGDLDGDGSVGSSDLDIVRASWGHTVAPWDFTKGDPSGDGTVNSADLDIVRANWGRTIPAAAGAPNTVDLGPAMAASPGKAYGPLRRAAPHRHDLSDAVFANARALAETAWADAIEALAERNERGDLARRGVVDIVFSEWE